MTLDEDIQKALYERMIGVITGADPAHGVPSVFDTKETMFVMAPQGLALKDADYYATNPKGEFNTANLVDDILDANPVYTPYGGKVSTVYKAMVTGVIVTEPKSSSEMEAKRNQLKAILENKDGTETQLVVREKAALDKYKDALLNYNNRWSEAKHDPNLRRQWPAIAPVLSMEVKRAYEDWGAAGRDQVKSVKAQLDTLNEGQVARAFQDAEERLGIDTTDARKQTVIYPSNWYSRDEMSWPRFKFSSSQYSATHTTETESWGAGAGINLGLWSFGGGVSKSYSRERLSKDTTEIGIEFNYRVCTINRPWMDASLFRLPNWNVGAYAGPGRIAGGSNPLMPTYPIAMVLVRNVRITGTWAKSDSDHINDAIAGSIDAGWGPFSVSGNYSSTSTTDKFQAKKITNGFCIPVMQIIGFVCAKVPYCPPKIKISMATIKKVREAEKYLRPH